MMKTPEEIKKGLECCLGDTHAYHCDECPYADDESEVDDGCDDNGIQLLEDALAYIQQLEAERDAAVALIPRACAYCKWYGTKHGGFHPDCKNPNGCRNVSGINTGWQWRVQKEE